MSTIAIIPARGGSKGMPLKNLAFLNGQPLIDWTIEAAQQSEEIDRIFVSTDSMFIAGHAKTFSGVEVVIRPDVISGDHAQIEDAMLHVIQQIPVDSDYNSQSEVVLLQPTSPIRRPHDIDAAIGTLRDHVFDSVFSATPIFPYVWIPPMEGAIIDSNAMERAFRPHELPRLSRQNRRPLLQENGSIYVTTVGDLMTSRNRLNGNVGYYRMPPWTAIEIDSYYDMAMADVTMEFYSEELS